MRLTVIDENAPDPGAQVALRVINATGSPIDVSQYVATAPCPPAPTWASVGAYAISSYVTHRAEPDQVQRPAGGRGATLFADPLALIGQPAGTRNGGCTVGVDCEAFQARRFQARPSRSSSSRASVAGSKAASFTTPGTSFMWDRRPPRSLHRVVRLLIEHRWRSEMREFQRWAVEHSLGGPLAFRLRVSIDRMPTVRAESTTGARLCVDFALTHEWFTGASRRRDPQVDPQSRSSTSCAAAGCR